MIPAVLYLWAGKLLTRTIGGMTGLATSADCCCGEPPPLCAGGWCAYQPMGFEGGGYYWWPMGGVTQFPCEFGGVGDCSCKEPTISATDFFLNNGWHFVFVSCHDGTILSLDTPP